jgi:glutamyl-tRNA reductase
LKLTMTGLDHRRANIVIREKFAVSKEKAVNILALMTNEDIAAGCVIISTCNRTELYASIPDSCTFPLSEKLCAVLGVNFGDYGSYLIEKTGDQAMKHLINVASGLDSQILGDDQVITQVREALELSRLQNCADSYLETIFRLSIQAAKSIKTNVFSNLLGSSSVPSKTVEKLKTMCSLAGKNAVVIGNGKIGRLAAELLIRENVNVTITLRTHKKGDVIIPNQAHTVSYDERYKIIENADIVISATTSPHTTISFNAISGMKQLPKIIVDLAVPRDVDPSIKNLNGITLLTIDDISGGKNFLSPEKISIAENIIDEHMAKYRQWLAYKETQKPRPFFPMFVDMGGRDVVVVGGGNIADRRIKIMIDYGMKITVIAPEVTEYIERAVLSQTIKLLNRKYQKGDIRDISPFLVITAADERQVNRAVTLEAKELNIPVSVADNRDECSFYFPAIAKNENYTAAVVSNNGNHRGVKETAQRIRELIDL